MRRGRPGDEGGFALLAVMLVLALLGVVTAEFAFSMRLEANMVRAYKEGILAAHLAEAGIQQAIREVLSEAPVQALGEDGQLVFYRVAVGQLLPTRLPALKRQRVPLGPGEFSYRITDEEARINLNLAPRDRIDRLLLALGVERRTRDVIADSLEDWKDTNDTHRLNGAESEDFYLKLPVPYRARNGPLLDTAELLQIRGVTPELYFGRPGKPDKPSTLDKPGKLDEPSKLDKPGLVEFVTVGGRNIVNINTAPPVVLKALGFSDAEISDIVQSRQRTPFAYLGAIGRFAGRGLGIGSQTFRIEAEGFVAGEPRARILAIVQKSARQPAPAVTLPGAAPAPPPPVVILSWRQGTDG